MLVNNERGEVKFFLRRIETKLKGTNGSNQEAKDFGSRCAKSTIVKFLSEIQY